VGSARARGRRAALFLYYATVSAVCVTASVQVVRQIFVAGPKSPYPTCRDGLRALASAVERARRAAADQDAPGEPSEPSFTGDEDEALGRFRAALDPEWQHRDGVAATCRGSRNDERALDAIERLRYAEEHAVRREAGDLAPLRRRVRAILDTDLAPGEAAASREADSTARTRGIGASSASAPPTAKP
jgi:hypothetical protein